MDAGRDLDALIAERVMGWARTGDNDWTSPGHYTERSPIDGSEYVASNWGGKGPHARLEASDHSGAFYLCGCQDDFYAGRFNVIDLPPYSRDIAAAWQVVEHFRAGGKSLQINATPGGFLVTNYDDEGRPLPGWSWDDAVVSDEGDTLPLAICRFALATVGARQPVR